MTFAFETARVEALVESARLLQSATDVSQLLSHLLRASMAHVLARRGFVAFDGGDGMQVVHARGLGATANGTPYDEMALRAAGIQTILPIGVGEQPVALLGVGAVTAGSVSPEQEQFLSALGGISAGAIENVRFSSDVRRLNETLARRVHELRTLLDLVRNFTAVTDAEEVARMLALTLSGQWAAPRFGVATWREGHPPMVRCSRGATLPAIELLRPAMEAVADWQLVERLEDGALRDQLQAQKFVALVPIRTGESSVGVFAMGPRAGGASYSEVDLGYSRGLVDQAAVALENAWNFHETLEKKKIEKELQLAADIQRRLLPATMPTIGGIESAASTRPARQVGGDYYDVVPLGESEQIFCVADVSGKGVAASLLMSNFQASLRAFAATAMPLPEIVTRMNSLMHASTAANKYVTAIFVAINPLTGRCRFVNAGHNDGIIVRRSGEVENIKAGGLAVGLMPGRTYAEVASSLEPGDVITLYSDGVTEANDVDENEFGIERLIEVVREGSASDLPQLVDDIHRAVDEFAGAAPQYDDITIMTLRRTG